MSRLTDKNVIAVCGSCSSFGICKPDESCFVKEAYAKLKRLEDLYEAGRLIELDDSFPARDELDRCTHRHCNNCDKYRRELKHYKDLEEAGRLITLPCKVGDTVWSCWIDGEKSGVASSKPINEQECILVKDLWGKRVFATKAEAEAKLAELKGGAE